MKMGRIRMRSSLENLRKKRLRNMWIRSSLGNLRKKRRLRIVRIRSSLGNLRKRRFRSMRIRSSLGNLRRRRLGNVRMLEIVKRRVGDMDRLRCTTFMTILLIRFH